VFENVVLRRIFEHKRNEVTEVWRKLHNLELNMYSSPNINWDYQMGKNEMGGACRMYGDRKVVYRVVVGGNMSERGHLGDPDVDGRVILRWIFMKSNVGVWTGSELAEDRDRWRLIVNAVMNLRVP
jgi:hypothetical protein